MNPNDFKEITGYNDTKFIVPNDYPEDDNTKNIFGIIEILFDRNYNHTTTSDDTSSASSASNKTDSSPRSVSSASTIFDSKLGTNGGAPKTGTVKAARGRAVPLDEFFTSAPRKSKSKAEAFAENISDKIYTIIIDTPRIERLKQCLKDNFRDDVTITHNSTYYGLYFDFSLPYRETTPLGPPDINVFTDEMTTPSYRPFHLSLHHNDPDPKIIPRVTTTGEGRDNPGAIHFRRKKEDWVVKSDPDLTEKTYRYQQRLDLGRGGRIQGFTNRVGFENYADKVTSNLPDDTMTGVIGCLNHYIFDYTPPSPPPSPPPSYGTMPTRAIVTAASAMAKFNTGNVDGTLGTRTLGTRTLGTRTLGTHTPEPVASATADSNTENKHGVINLSNSGEFSDQNTSGSNTGENSMDVVSSRGGFKTTKTRKNKTTKTRKNKTTKKTRKIKRRKKTRKRSKDISKTKTKTRKHR
jgi:hypothetical protein